MTDKKYYCEECKVVEILKPEYCCSGYECGCHGYPIDPPLCEACWVERYAK